MSDEKRNVLYSKKKKKNINLETNKERRDLGWLVAVKDTGFGYRTLEFSLDWGGVFSGQ